MTRTKGTAVTLSRKTTLRCAQVGAFKKMSPADNARSITTLGAIAAVDRDFLCDQDLAHDVINLAHGRDFLREDRHYDIVVVHSVLSPKITMVKTFPRLRVSPYHSITNWKKRLSATRAMYIAICETEPATLSGREIGEIVGYKIVERNGFMTLYRKEESR